MMYHTYIYFYSKRTLNDNISKLNQISRKPKLNNGMSYVCALKNESDISLVIAY